MKLLDQRMKLKWDLDLDMHLEGVLLALLGVKLLPLPLLLPLMVLGQRMKHCPAYKSS